MYLTLINFNKWFSEDTIYHTHTHTPVLDDRYTYKHIIIQPFTFAYSSHHQCLQKTALIIHATHQHYRRRTYSYSQDFQKQRATSLATFNVYLVA